MESKAGKKRLKPPRLLSLAVPLPRPPYLFRFSSTLFVLFLFHRRHCPRGARSNVMGSRTNGLRHCVGIYWTRPWTKVCHCKLWFVHVPLLRRQRGNHRPITRFSGLRSPTWRSISFFYSFSILKIFYIPIQTFRFLSFARLFDSIISFRSPFARIGKNERILKTICEKKARHT